MRHFIVEVSRQTGIFADHRSGAVAIEYSLVASLISIVILLAVGLVGGAVLQLFNAVAAAG